MFPSRRSFVACLLIQRKIFRHPRNCVPALEADFLTAVRHELIAGDAYRRVEESREQEKRRRCVNARMFHDVQYLIAIFGSDSDNASMCFYCSITATAIMCLLPCSSFSISFRNSTARSNSKSFAARFISAFNSSSISFFWSLLRYFATVSAIANGLDF